MGLNKQERAEHKAGKDRETRKQRRRMKMWFDQQARTITNSQKWDAAALKDENIEQYRDAVNRNNGMFDEEFETGRSKYRPKKSSNEE